MLIEKRRGKLQRTPSKLLSESIKERVLSIQKIYTNMGQKNLMRKMKQAGRREARKEIRDAMKTFEEHLRPKPTWVPNAVWRWGMRIFIKL